jgi:hypothetical protein
MLIDNCRMDILPAQIYSILYVVTTAYYIKATSLQLVELLCGMQIWPEYVKRRTRKPAKLRNT